VLGRSVRGRRTGRVREQQLEGRQFVTDDERRRRVLAVRQ
jgi:hypothetical protein